MAYLDLSPTQTAPAFARARRGVAAPLFGAREWMVILLSRRDTLASVRSPGRLRAAIAMVFGLRRTNRLADDRLEALRRMAVLLRIGGADDAERNSFFAAGYSRGQLTMLAAQVSS